MRGRYRSIRVAPLSLTKKKKEKIRRDWATDIGQRGIKGKGISDDDVYEMRDGDVLGRRAFGTSGRKRGGKKPFDFLLSISSWLTYWIGI